MDNKTKESVIKKKEVFNTDVFYDGIAIQAMHHTGDYFNAIIIDSGLDFIQCIRSNSKGDILRVDIDLEDYINGSWIIERLQ